MTQLRPVARRLIAQAAQAEKPSAAQRSRLRASVLARVGAVAVVGSTGTAAAASTATSAGAAATATVGSLAAAVVKVVAVTAIAGALGTAGYVLAPVDDKPHHAVAPMPSAAVVRAPDPVAPAQPTSVALTDAPLADPPTALQERESRSLSPVTRPPAPLPSAAVADTFDSETRALREALALLRDRNPERALSALDAQGAAYAGGALAEERAVARIEALCAMGRMSDARTLAGVFLDEHPRSLQTARVRASCGGAGGAPQIP